MGVEVDFASLNQGNTSAIRLFLIIVHEEAVVLEDQEVYVHGPAATRILQFLQDEQLDGRMIRIVARQADPTTFECLPTIRSTSCDEGERDGRVYLVVFRTSG